MKPAHAGSRDKAGLAKTYFTFLATASAAGVGIAMLIFAPMPGAGDRAVAMLPGDVVPWPVLGQVSHPIVNGRIEHRFGEAVASLDGRRVRLSGFMAPFDFEDRHTHFLLTASPRTCFDCWVRGPEGWVDVIAASPVEDTYDQILVSGRFEILRDDPESLHYRLTDAARVRRDAK
jgi:hypothetical protein